MTNQAIRVYANHVLSQSDPHKALESLIEEYDVELSTANAKLARIERLLADPINEYVPIPPWAAQKIRKVLENE